MLIFLSSTLIDNQRQTEFDADQLPQVSYRNTRLVAGSQFRVSHCAALVLLAVASAELSSSTSACLLNEAAVYSVLIMISS